MIIAGIDIGQAQDHTALSIVRRIPLPVPKYNRKHQYALVYLEEIPLGTPYPDQIDWLVSKLSSPAVKGCKCGVDYTGVGRPIFDLLKKAKPPARLFSMLTTAGTNITFDKDKREYHIPKREQVSLLQVLMESNLLLWSDSLALGEKLADQLKKYQMKQTEAKNHIYGAMTGNDDLVSATMSAVWLGEQTRSDPINSETVAVGGECMAASFDGG